MTFALTIWIILIIIIGLAAFPEFGIVLLVIIGLIAAGIIALPIWEKIEKRREGPKEPELVIPKDREKAKDQWEKKWGRKHPTRINKRTERKSLIGIPDHKD